MSASARPSDKSISRGDWVRHATQILTEATVDSPRLSAECLVCHVCDISRVALATRPEIFLDAAHLCRVNGLLRRRMEGEPVAYLVGKKEFFGRDYFVTPATLIPRPETELLIETALATFSDTASPVRFADMGTGSGCIAVTLCAERPNWYGLAVDRSARALQVTHRNAVQYGTLPQIQPVLADFSFPLLREATLDLVISNPPYVGLQEYKSLSQEVRDFEPVTALVPGFVDSDRAGHLHEHQNHEEHDAHLSYVEGLEHLIIVAEESSFGLRPGGLLLMEHGCTQGQAIVLWLERHNWKKVSLHKDLAGLDRFVSAHRAED